MPSSRMSVLLVPAFVVIALFQFTPSLSAQDCSTCSYSPCDTYCDYCLVFSMDGCAQYVSTTCSQWGSCGGCAVTGSRTATQRYKYLADGGATYCMGRDYWYGSTNWSQYQRYITEVVTINYQTTTCNGVATEQEVSRSSQFGECYEFTNGNCQTGDTYLSTRVNGKECYW